MLINNLQEILVLNWLPVFLMINTVELNMLNIQLLRNLFSKRSFSGTGSTNYDDFFISYIVALEVPIISGLVS